MGKKITNMILFLLVAAGLTAMTLYIGRTQPSVMLYNFVFLVIMAAMYFAGMFGGMFRIDDLSKSLKKANEEVKDIFKIPGKVKASDLAALDKMFENRYLDNKYDEFSDAINQSEEGIGDIEDYINSDEIDVHVHKRLLEMVPDIFTSLGILGTFVGLVWGLKNFEPSNYEAMTSSVASLVDGIKVAFLTSIYGIAFSIIYNYSMKSEYSEMTENLQAFLNRFHSHVMPSAENESRNLLIASQKIQTDAMNGMAEQFSVIMAESFEKVITPTFQKMNDSLDLLVDSVTRVQTDAVQEILDLFLKEMRSSFQLQFNDFNKALVDLKKAQEETTDFTVGLYENMSKELADSYTAQNKAMQDAVTKLGNLQSRFMTSAAKIVQENEEIQKAQQQDYQHVVQYLKEAEQSAAKFWVACNQTMKRYVETASEGVQTANAAGQQTMQVQENFNRMATEFNIKMSEFAEYQKRSYKVMQQVERLLADISAVGTGDAYITGGRKDTVKTQKTLDSIQRLIEEQSENQQALMDDMSKNIKEMQKNAQKNKFGLFK